MKPLLEIKNLSIDFKLESSRTKAVNNVSLSVNRNQGVAIVGESGSGKSVTALSVLKLLASPPAEFHSGQILFSEDGQNTIDLLKLGQSKIQEIRGNKIGMIFQEPMSSLNPVFSCGYQIREALLYHKKLSVSEAKSISIEWLRRIKLPDPEKTYHKYPHQLSGGQKQRVMIAMAMCCHPSLLICDEPTTALDVTVQKSIFELIRDLQKDQNIGIIFITHDLSVVSEIADQVIVMYKGQIVEQNTVNEIFRNPLHPYTKGLLACRPAMHPKGKRLPVVSDFLDAVSDSQPPTCLPASRLPTSNIQPTLFSQ